MDFHKHILGILKNELSKEIKNSGKVLLDLLRVLSKWRIELIRNAFIKSNGLNVVAGPFAGMLFMEHSQEGCHIPKLLGCYEQPLWSTIEQVIKRSYSTVIHIGCAEGYYAVGLSRRMPKTKVFAYDINVKAVNACKSLAELNKTLDLFEFGYEFSQKDFEKFRDEDTLIFCDIEGAEIELLDPRKVPCLSDMDILVETHDINQHGVLHALTNRFQDTHEITKIEDNGQRYLPKLPSWFLTLPHLDQLLAVWEMRSGPTPWLVMKSITKKSLDI